ncbi:MAG: alpha-hydroxy-acid oxidizing protein, partial [Acidimicrobiia bacterium]
MSEDFPGPAGLEQAARERLPSMVYDYFAGGADDEATLADNVAAFRRLKLRHRVLAGVGERDTSTT